MCACEATLGRECRLHLSPCFPLSQHDAWTDGQTRLAVSEVNMAAHTNGFRGWNTHTPNTHDHEYGVHTPAYTHTHIYDVHTPAYYTHTAINMMHTSLHIHTVNKWSCTNRRINTLEHNYSLKICIRKKLHRCVRLYVRCDII